ncbi:MAG: hypothetical protein M3Q98_08205 [Actinomycetota bacterium]|nr:hypothetical protein [Actinomycetota bacterium]
MDEVHVDEDELIALALGDLGPGRASALRHFNSCQVCRSAYDDLSQTIDAVLPASPSLAPTAGFDARVLDRLELGRPGMGAPERRRSYRIPLLVAAAAIIGLGVGAIGAQSLIDQGTTSASDRGASLVTAKGSTVGTVEPSRAGGKQVVVLQITGGRPGAHYTCRVRLDDGTVREMGDWVMPESGHATWIADSSASNIDRIDLVTDSGKVWSTAKLS